MTPTREASGRRWRYMLWSLAAMLVLAVALPSLGYAVSEAGAAQESAAFGPDRDSNPRADMWRSAREGNVGSTAQSGPYVTNTFINNSGQIWREIKTGPLITYGGWVLLLALLVLAAVFALTGQNKIEGGRTGMTVPRWSMFERVVHWFVGIAFVVLAITGLSLLFGRSVLIPLFGAAGFAAYAQVGMLVHNFVGPAFAVGLLVMILMWIKDNIPSRLDLEWFRKGGGYFRGGHASADKLNGGEKAWFWLGVLVLGLIVSVSGFVLDFPNWGFQSRTTMAVAQVTHAAGALLWIAVFFGHVYIATLGTEGALEGMTSGRVDIAWAKQHHDRWYDELIARGEKPRPGEPPRPRKPPRSDRPRSPLPATK